MGIEFSAVTKTGMVQVTCRIGSVDVPLHEARRVHDYLAAEQPYGAFRVRGQSADIAALWLDRTLEDHLIVHAAPATTRAFDAVTVMPSDPNHACSLYRAIVTAAHVQWQAT